MLEAWCIFLFMLMWSCAITICKLQQEVVSRNTGQMVLWPVSSNASPHHGQSPTISWKRHDEIQENWVRKYFNSNGLCGASLWPHGSLFLTDGRTRIPGNSNENLDVWLCLPFLLMTDYSQLLIQVSNFSEANLHSCVNANIEIITPRHTFLVFENVMFHGTTAN